MPIHHERNGFFDRIPLCITAEADRVIICKRCQHRHRAAIRNAFKGFRQIEIIFAGIILCPHRRVADGANTIFDRFMRTGKAAACACVILEQTFVVCALMRTLDDSNILCQLSGSSILGNYIACRGIFVVYGKSIACLQQIEHRGVLARALYADAVSLASTVGKCAGCQLVFQLCIAAHGQAAVQQGIALQIQHAAGCLDGGTLPRLGSDAAYNFRYRICHGQCAALECNCVVGTGIPRELRQRAILERNLSGFHGQWNAVTICHPIGRIGYVVYSFAVTQNNACLDAGAINDNILANNRQQRDICTICRLDGSGQRSVLLAVALRRQICTAGALFAVIIGLIKVVAFRRCRVAAHAALRAVGEPIGVGGAGQGVTFCLGRAAGARPGVGICIGRCPAVILVALRSFGLAAQLAHRRVRVAVICVSPVMLKALLKGRATLAGGPLHFSGGCSYSAQHTDGRRRQLAGTGRLPVKVQRAALRNIHKAGDGQRCPVAQNQVDLAGNIEQGDREILFYHIPARCRDVIGTLRDLRAVGLRGQVPILVDVRILVRRAQRHGGVARNTLAVLAVYTFRAVILIAAAACQQARRISLERLFSVLGVSYPNAVSI